MQGNGVPSLKMDPDSKPGEGWIKSEPNLVDISPTLQADEDIYEDTGDLDFKAASQCLYLTRIPKMLWESWSKLNEDQEIVLGRVRVEGTLDDVKRASLLASLRDSFPSYHSKAC